VESLKQYQDFGDWMDYSRNAPRPECPKPSRNAPNTKSQCTTAFGLVGMPQ